MKILKTNKLQKYHAQACERQAVSVSEKARLTKAQKLNTNKTM